MKDNECVACGSKDPVGGVNEYHMNFGKDRKALCRLCACTKSGLAYEFPESYPNADILFTICRVGNEILKCLNQFTTMK